ncbi:MAG: hypothetical protein ABUL44_01110 [Flavobacterium sp.]
MALLQSNKDHIAKQAAVFIKLRLMQVASRLQQERPQIGCGADY